MSYLSWGGATKDLLEIIQATIKENNQGLKICWNIRTSLLKKLTEILAEGWERASFIKVGEGLLVKWGESEKEHSGKTRVCEDLGYNELDILKNQNEEQCRGLHKAARWRVEWQAWLLCRNGPWCPCWEVPLAQRGSGAQPTFILRCRSKIAFSWGNWRVEHWPLVPANFISQQVTIHPSWWKIQRSLLQGQNIKQIKSKRVWGKGQKCTEKSSCTSHMKEHFQPCLVKCSCSLQYWSWLRERPGGFAEVGSFDTEFFMLLIKMSLGWFKNIFIGTWVDDSVKDSIQVDSLEHTRLPPGKNK